MAITEKRRRRKVRIVDQESSDSSSESDNQHVDSDSDEPSELSGLSDAGSDSDHADAMADDLDTVEPRQRLRKMPANETTAEFNQKFLELVTRQFGDELSQLREANDFGPSSLNQLVAGLKQGIDIFDPEQQKLL